MHPQSFRSKHHLFALKHHNKININLDGNRSRCLAPQQVPGSRLQSPGPGLWYWALAGAARPAAGGLPRHRSLPEDVRRVATEVPGARDQEEGGDEGRMSGDIRDSLVPSCSPPAR